MQSAYVLDDEMDLPTYQLRRLNELILFLKQCNLFYQEKLLLNRLPLLDLEDVRGLPFTTKNELVADQLQHPPYGHNHSYPEHRYVRYHQTSGTKGRPLKVLDTEESWEWWTQCWLTVLQAAGITKNDRVFMAFSFGPFIGFWSAYEGAKRIGAMVIPGGGQSSQERLTSMMENEATVLLSTPSYAIHLGEVASKENLSLVHSSLRLTLHAGEPGASIPSVREHIENIWGARSFDHAGMTEMGAYGYSCLRRDGIHINEREFYSEIVDRDTLEPVSAGAMGELVLTNFGRLGYPLLRYRTGDLVKNQLEMCACGDPYRFLPGGILGRADDMVVVRGINIYPQSIEAIVREFPEIEEFRVIYYTEKGMDQVRVQIEAPLTVPSALRERLRQRLALRIDVEVVGAHDLPRFDMKARRVVDERLRLQ